MIYGKHSKRLLFFDIFYIFPSNESAVRILIERERASSVELQISNKSACVIRVLQISNESAGVFRCTTNIKQVRARLLLYWEYQTRARAVGCAVNIEGSARRSLCCEYWTRARAVDVGCAANIEGSARRSLCCEYWAMHVCPLCCEYWTMKAVCNWQGTAVINVAWASTIKYVAVAVQICFLFIVFYFLIYCNYQTTYIKSKLFCDISHMSKSIVFNVWKLAC